MTRDEQIEEMAKIMRTVPMLQYSGSLEDFLLKRDSAKAIYAAGYRKIDDNCAVITKDDLNLYKKQAVKEFAEMFKNGLSNCSGCYIPDCFERATDEFAYSEKDLLKLIDKLLKEYE